MAVTVAAGVLLADLDAADLATAMAALGLPWCQGPCSLWGAARAVAATENATVTSARNCMAIDGEGKCKDCLRAMSLRGRDEGVARTRSLDTERQK